MPSDRDRLSFDPQQFYRAVVAQSGRTIVPADINEAHEIFLDERRAHTLDMVGRIGTPDDGYGIQFLPPPNLGRDFGVRAGTMYVGGQRAFLPSAISYLSQPDWLLRPLPGEEEQEYIYLLLEEREISAVEDETLKDVALGGPDTSQRLRLMQRIVRVPTRATTCAEALRIEIARLAGEGWHFSSATMLLSSQARMQVNFEDPGGSLDPCEPTQTGGYLGADNQLMRIRTTGPDRFVWGYDNAAFLYRVDIVDDQTVRLQAPPVDAFHFPRVGQVVELLASDALLANGEFVAADTGHLFTLTEAYNPDARTIRLPAAIPPQFLVPDGTPRLFLRVWHEELDFTPNTPVSLPETGIQVTFNAAAPLHTGDHWAFAVRPATPVAMYPQRYLDTPQPPEAPRRWICPLAIIAWTSGAAGNVSSPVADCRRHFDNLVELTEREGGNGCCTIQIRPEDVAAGDLSQVIAGLPADQAVSVCFTPGTYVLTKPVVINRSQISLVACPGGVTLRPEGPEVFANGIFMVSDASNIEISGFHFELEDGIVPDGRLYGIDADVIAGQLQGPNFLGIRFAIGIRLEECNGVAIRHCEFRYSVMTQGNSFSAGILASGRCRGLQVENCIFQRDQIPGGGNDLLIFQPERYRVWLGLVYVPAIQITAVTPVPGAQLFVITGRVTASRLDAVWLSENHFEGLTAATFIQADHDDLHLHGNTAERCYSGFWVLGRRVIGTAEQVLTIDHRELGRMLSDNFLVDPVLQVAATIAYGVAGRTIAEGSPFTNVSLGPQFPPLPPFLQFPLGEQFNRLWNYLRRAQLSALGGAVLLPAATFVSRNRALVLQDDDQSPFRGPGLVLWGDVPIGDQDTQRLPNSKATVDANIVEAESLAVPSMAVMLVTHSAVTGNVVKNNPSDAATSLLVYSTVRPPIGGAGVSELSPVTVTGNTCRGRMLLPPRNLAPPFNRWDPFNTQSFLP